MSTGDDPDEPEVDDFEALMPPPKPPGMDDDEYTEMLRELLRRELPPQPKPIPLPEHWTRLMIKVAAALDRNTRDPEGKSRYKIDRFEVVFVRGRGGYGLVFEVYDPKLDRNVALKLCQVRDGRTAEETLAEARMLAQVRHPHIITVHEVGEWDPDVYYVMDFASGRSLEHYVENNWPPWQDVVEIYMGAGQGLVAAHERDKPIIHGDFKASNVLVEADGSWPRVADFGLARVRLENTPDDELEAVRGTLAAPEVLCGLAGDERSDQWSFCMSVWHTLALLEAADRAAAEQGEPFQPPLAAGIPEQLRDVLKRGMEVEPGDRWPDMRSLLAAIDAARRAGPRLVDVVDLEPISDVLPRRRKGPGWGPSAIALLIAAGSVMMASRSWRGSEDRISKLGLSSLVRETTESISFAPASGCSRALVDDDHEITLAANYVCDLIRVGEWKEAATYWKGKYKERHGDVLAENDEIAKAAKKRALGNDALSIAQTAVRQAARHLLRGDQAEAGRAATFAESRATEAASMLGEKHAGALEVTERAKTAIRLAQP